MAVLEIRTYPDDVLRRKADPVRDVEDPDFQRLIDDMVDTMLDAPGVGLAAPQVGVSKRLCVIDTTVGEEPDALHVLINPEIVGRQGDEVAEEGCLSVPGYFTSVRRAQQVTVRYLDRGGVEHEREADGLLARAVQHEMDHLDGVLFIDRIGLLKKELFKKKYRKLLAEASAP